MAPADGYNAPKAKRAPTDPDWWRREKGNRTMSLSDEERAELEALRAAKRANDEAERERMERQELENLRQAQKYAQEDAEYYAERERRREERRKERENPDYGLEDLPPMPLRQKVVIGVIAAMAVLLVVYLIWYNGAH